VRALVVDDSRATRSILRRMLESIGFEVEQAENGRVALDLLCASVPYDVPDLALVDWNMPVMDGIELIEAIRQMPDFDGLKVIMCTTETEISQMSLALLSGANEYVTKPFTADTILDKMIAIGMPVESA
jgi:two-component system, chemotaxis family, chemotaxis protein CheY